MTRFSRICLVVLVAALLLSSCAFNRNVLIGTWKEDASGAILQFSPDGKLIQSSPDAPGSSYEIGYRFLNDDTIHLLGTQNVFTFKVEGNTLTLSAQGQALTLTRVK